MSGVLSLSSSTAVDALLLPATYRATWRTPAAGMQHLHPFLAGVRGYQAGINAAFRWGPAAPCCRFSFLKATCCAAASCAGTCQPCQLAR